MDPERADSLGAWLERHDAWLQAVGVVSLVTAVTSLVLLPVFVARIPEDYFARPDRPPSRWRGAHPAARAALWIARNVLGWLLVPLGVAMLVLPGQGLLTLLAAAILVDFPGKRRLELALMRRRVIQRGVDWIRSRAGRPPLVVWDP